jgi:RNA polymerase sigma-70 factor (ECF subfamily)
LRAGGSDTAVSFPAAGIENLSVVDPFADLTQRGEVVRETGEDLSELARSAAAGDRRATHTLLLKVGPAMLRAARRVLGRRTEDVEDVVQEAMQALVDALPRFKGQCTVPHFAWRVAVLTALANRRRLDLRAQWAADPTETTIEEVSEDRGSADAALLRGRREALSALLDELPPEQAEVLVLHAAYGFTIEELAGTIGRPLETIRSRLRLAKQVLRDRIDANPDLADVLKVTS